MFQKVAALALLFITGISCRVPSPARAVDAAYAKPVQLLAPETVWAAGYGIGKNADIYVASWEQPQVLRVDSRNGSILQRFVYTPELQCDHIIAAQSSVFLSLVEGGDDRIVVQVDQESGKQVSSISLPNQMAFLGASAAGDVLLAGPTFYYGHALVTVDPQSGNILASFDGGLTHLAAVAGALHPSNGQVYVISRNGSDVSRYFMAVISADNKLLLQFPLINEVRYITSMAADQCSTGSMVVVMVQAGPEYVYRMDHYDTATGRLVASIMIAGGVPNPFITYCTHDEQAVGDVMFVDFLALGIQVIDLSEQVPFVVGEYPILPTPTAMATLMVEGTETLLVATNMPNVVYKLGTDGRLVSLFPMVAPVDCAFHISDQAVTTDTRGRVYILQCNGSVTVYDGKTQQVLLNSARLPNTTILSIAAGPADTLYVPVYTNKQLDPEIALVDLHSGQIVNVLKGRRGRGVLASTVVDERNGNIWTVDLYGFIYQFAANGTELSYWNLSTAAHPQTGGYLLAVDYVHDCVVASVEETFYRAIVWLDGQSGRIVDTYVIDQQYVPTALTVSRNGTTYVVNSDNTMLLFQVQSQAVAKLQPFARYLLE